jgi:hypothetical protein
MRKQIVRKCLYNNFYNVNKKSGYKKKSTKSGLIEFEKRTVTMLALHK